MSKNCRFGVAVHVCVLLALKGSDCPDGASVTSDWIASSVNTNPVVVRRLIASLARAGLVKSHRGIKGGTILAVPPQSISLLDISKAVEAEGELTSTHNQPPNQNCPVCANIVGVLLPVLAKVEAVKERELASVSLADLVGQVSQAALKAS